jgi:thiamine transport system ATP-binding protein
MLDEPLGSLDRTLREQLLTDMRSLFVGLGVTVLYVTHDRDEVFTIADDLVVMDEGKIRGAGRAETMWTNPQTIFVARFLGHQNLLNVEVRNGRCHIGQLEITLGDVADGHHTIVVPGEAIRTDGNGAVTAEAKAGSFRAGIHTTTGELADGNQLTFAGGPFGPGDAVQLTIDPHRVVVVRD